MAVVKVSGNEIKINSPEDQETPHPEVVNEKPKGKGKGKVVAKDTNLRKLIRIAY
jgi:hypothetical protein